MNKQQSTLKQKTNDDTSDMTRMMERMMKFCKSQSESEASIGCFDKGATCNPEMFKDYSGKCGCT